MVMKFRKGNVPGVGLMKGNGTSVISGKSRLMNYFLGDSDSMTDPWDERYIYLHLVGGFKYFLMFTPNFGEDEPILTSIFFKGVETTN